MYIDYHHLTEEELDRKIQSIQSKMNIAYQLGHEDVVEKLRLHLDQIYLEMNERMEIARFQMISDKIPESYIVGEDKDDPDEFDDDEY